MVQPNTPQLVGGLEVPGLVQQRAMRQRSGKLKPGNIIIEPTSGNTGIGLAMVAAVKGYKLILVMPESMSVERRKLMSLYGATFELTPREKGMKGAIEKASEIASSTPGSWIPSQFDNPANISIHKKTTAAEILRDFPEGIDYLITGVGTGGHITAVGEVLKEKFPKMKVFAVEPELSPVISGGSPGPHPIQGIGAGFVPVNLHTAILDGVIHQGGRRSCIRLCKKISQRRRHFCQGSLLEHAVAARSKKLPSAAKKQDTYLLL